MKFKLLLSQKAKDYFASQRLLLIVAFMLMAAYGAQAQVSITTATGGTGISADKAANSINPAGGSYHALGNIVISEGTANVNTGDFGTNVTELKLNAPSGWEFRTSGVIASVSGDNGGQNISVGTITYSASAITLPLNVGHTNKRDILTISGVQVRALNGANIPNTGNITPTFTGTINGLLTSTNLGTLSQSVGALNQLVVTLPGEIFTDAATKAGSGNSGSVAAQETTVPFNIAKLTATDQFFNIIASYSGNKTISYIGPSSGFAAPSYTTAVIFSGGQSTTILATTLTKAETTTLTASDGTISGPASSSLTVNKTITSWLGNTSSDWHTAANWNKGLPTPDKDVEVNSVITSTPIISGPASAGNITIGGTLTLRSTLNLYGNLTNNGTVVAYTKDTNGTVSNSSLVKVYGSGTIGGSSTTSFLELSVETAGATVALSGNVNVARKVILKGNLNSGGKLTLLSDIYETASVENLTGVVSGNVTVQRSIVPHADNPTGLGYRHYASPVQNMEVANLATTTGFTPEFNAAYNSNPNANYDPYPNVFGYNQVRLDGTNNGTQHFDYGWYSPASNEVMAPGKGYTVNIAGDQKVNFVGELNNDDVVVAITKKKDFLDAGWHLLGNPYTFDIDWNKIIKPTGMDEALYVWRSTGEYSGLYDSYVNGIPVVKPIAPMQGFFVHVNNSEGFNFTINKDARTSEKASFFRIAADERPQLQLSLKDTKGLADNTYVYFQKEATFAVNGQFDAYKVQTYNEDRPTLFANMGKDAISIKGLPLITTAQALPLEFYVPKAGNFTFSVAKFVNFPAAASVQLLDKKTNQSYDLSQGREITLALTTTEPHRFVLNFSAVAAASPLSAGDLVKTGVEAIVYPNPAKGDLNLVISGLEASPEAVEVVLYNTLGQLVLRNNVSATQAQTGVTLQTSNFAGGIYHLHIKAAGKTITKKVVLSR